MLHLHITHVLSDPSQQKQAQHLHVVLALLVEIIAQICGMAMQFDLAMQPLRTPTTAGQSNINTVVQIRDFNTTSVDMANTFQRAC